MKMKLREVNKNLNRMERIAGMVFPTKLSFTIACNIETLQREAERIEKERRKLCEQYAEKDSDGNAVMIDSIIDGKKRKEYKMSDENQKQLEREYNDLLDTEVEVDIRKVKQEVIERCETQERYSIPSVLEIISLSFMIEG